MRKCPICKQKYEPKYSSIEPCPQYSCRLALYEKANKNLKAKAEKERKENEKSDRLVKKQMRESLKTLGQYEKEAKREFQKWIRKRDAELPCISCGTFRSTVFDGGHYKKAELYSGVIFHPLNCHKQCGKCNRYLGGNELNFRNGLIERYGNEAIFELEKIADETRYKKYTREDLIEIRQKYFKLNKLS